MAIINFNFNLAPKEAIKYLQKKGYKLSFDYNELQKEAHHKAFTVAKVTKLDLLNDIFTNIDAALKDGRSFEDFKKKLVPTLKKKGWWGEQNITNPKTGEVKTINIGSRRLRTIYKTNMRVAYQVGRYKQMKALPTSVYWRYKSALLENTRDEHANMHGIILHRDDSWWNTNYPPNGWGCHCKVTAHSMKDIEKRGWKIEGQKQPNIASKDWSHNVGDGSTISNLNKINLDKSLNNLPSTTKNNNYSELNEDELKDTFYKKLGVKRGEIFIDKVNDPMVIDDNLFKSAGGHSKLKKQDRHLLIDGFADTIANPDEIYLEHAVGKISGQKRLVKKMFKYYKTDNNAKRAIQVIFEYLEDKTLGVTAHLLDSSGGVEKKRIEKLVYKRE